MFKLEELLMRWRKLTSCTGSRKNSNLIIYLAVVSEPFSRSWRERSKFIHNFRLLTAGHVFYFRVRQFFIHEPWTQRVGMVCRTHVLSQSLPVWKISPHTSCLISRDEQTVSSLRIFDILNETSCALWKMNKTWYTRTANPETWKIKHVFHTCK